MFTTTVYFADLLNSDRNVKLYAMRSSSGLVNYRVQIHKPGKSVWYVFHSLLEATARMQQMVEDRGTLAPLRRNVSP